MARSLRIILLGALAFGFISTLPMAARTTFAAEMDKKGKADAKGAMRLYKEGNYEDAARLFVKLSLAYPDMLVFVRNLGACYYYLRRYEPALSNLRDYEHRKKDLAPDDRAEVEGWIGEMERLRDQATAPPPVQMPVVPAPAPASEPTPTATPTPPAPPAPVMASSPPTVVAPSPPAAPPPLAPQPPVYQAPTYPAPAPYQTQSAYPPQGGYGASSSPYATPPYSPSMYPEPNQPPAAAPEGAPPLGVTTPAADSGSSGSGRKVAAWLIGLASVGTAAAGGFFTAKGLDDFSKVETKYDPTLEKQGKDAINAGWICYGVGAAGLITALIIGSSGGGSSPGVALAPAVGPGTAGAVVGGRF